MHITLSFRLELSKEDKQIKITKDKGVIAIDTNASPLHLAIAEVSPDGNLLIYQGT